MCRLRWVSLLMLGLSVHGMVVGLISLLFPVWFSRFWVGVLVPSMTLPWRMLGLSYVAFSLLFLWMLKQRIHSLALYVAVAVFIFGIAVLHVLSSSVHTDILSVLVFELPALGLFTLMVPWKFQVRQQREQGVVKWYNPRKGFGFIRRHSGVDVFVQRRSVHIAGSRALQEGQLVDFFVVQGEKGWYADDVRLRQS